MVITKETKNLTILTIFMAIAWLLFELYNSYYATSIPEEYTKLAEPFVLDIDIEYLKDLSTKSL